MKAAILNDLSRCAGCQACVYACKQINELPADGAEQLSATTWMRIERRGGVNIRRSCMHCVDPACASVCPVAALRKTPEGPVVYDVDRCIGCRYCMVACPFHVPTYEWSSAMPRVRKCIMCFDKRVSKGEQPACAEACPTGATLFGDRDALIREAGARIGASPGRYINHIYGVAEAGGTSILYISPVPFEQLGFPPVQTDPYPRLTWNVLSKLPNVVSVAGLGLLGINWIVRRRDTLDRVRRGEISEEEARGPGQAPGDSSRHGKPQGGAR